MQQWKGMHRLRASGDHGTAHGITHRGFERDTKV